MLSDDNFSGRRRNAAFVTLDVAGVVAAVMAATLLHVPRVVGQSDSTWMSGTTTVVPGPHYEAGWLHRAFLGDHYRDLWTRNVEVPILNFDGFQGGIVPLCRGGGFQTRSLRFAASNGAEYVFRSVDKDPTARLPMMLRETFIADVLQDQISSHHPAGALVVAPLLEATGVLHATPRLVVMPDDERLGPFRAEYAGLLGFIEERPIEGPDGAPGFGNSRQISGTERVWEEIEDSPENRVDAVAFLRARIMDMFLGDWDRHYDQWRWARYPDSAGYTWKPIPRDRDQAFARLDGIVLDIARMSIPEIVSFDESYGNIFGLTWTGRAIDRRFLSGVSWETWGATVVDLQNQLTDSVIADAVRRLPAEIYETEGEGLEATLRERREGLPEAARAFYEVLAKYVDIHATDEDEFAEIVRTDDGVVRVQISSSESRTRAPQPYFAREFSDDETNEIRLYLHGGDDRAIVRGAGNARLLVRVIGGGGDDAFVDSTLSAAGIRTKFYDSRGENEFQRGLAASFDRRRFQPPEVEIRVAERAEGACGGSTPEAAPRDLALPFRDWGSFWLMLPWTTVQPDIGLFVGGGVKRIGYGFRRAPYKSMQAFRFGYASGPMRFRAEYEGDFRGVAGGVGASLNLRYSGIDNIRFHGLGNETVLAAPDPFFRIATREVSAAPSLTAHPTPATRVAIGPRFRYVRTVLGSGNLVDVNRPVGSEPVALFGLRFDVQHDTRDDKAAARRGAFLALGAFAYRGSGSSGVEYGGVEGELRTYLTATGFPLRPTLALRTGGKKLWGTYPYFHAAYLSGGSNLRGFAEQRFAGDAAVFGNAELRLFLTRYRVLLPGEFGILGLADGGRVFLEGETSSQWHGAVGGGIWFAFVERAATVSISIARSEEMSGLYLKLGYGF